MVLGPLDHLINIYRPIWGVKCCNLYRPIGYRAKKWWLIRGGLGLAHKQTID